MTCAIIDDEPLAAELLANYASKTAFLTLTGTYNSAIEAMRFLRTSPVDLLFLDIQMPELSGLEFATILSPQTMIIFTTAFERYAVDSYKVNCIDYLLKPISYEDFLHAANKALARCEEATNIRTTASNISTDRFIYIKSEYKLVRIFLDDILYIEGLKDYVCFHLRAGSPSAVQSEKVLCLINMKTVEEVLPQPEFMRVHRSYIVRMPAADVIDRYRIIIGEVTIPISDSQKDTIMQFVNSHSI